jgi:hypothetical protein
MKDEMAEHKDLHPSSFTLHPSYVARWIELMDLCEEFLLAGLRREVGPDGDLAEAYRRWYAGWQDEHDRPLLRVLERVARAEKERGR